MKEYSYDQVTEITEKNALKAKEKDERIRQKKERKLAKSTKIIIARLNKAILKYAKAGNDDLKISLPSSITSEQADEIEEYFSSKGYYICVQLESRVYFANAHICWGKARRYYE